MIGRLRLPFPALDDGRIQIDGGDLLVRTAPPDLLYHFLVDLRQTSQWGTFLSDITHLTDGNSLLRLLELLLVVKLVEKLACRFRARHLVTQHLRHAGVLAQAIEILQTIARPSVFSTKKLSI